MIRANQEAPKGLLPVKKKCQKKKQISAESRVINAPEKNKNAIASVCIEKPTEQNRKKLERCKSLFQKIYVTILEEELDKLIAKADAKSKRTGSWKLINQVTGKKSVKQAMIKANPKFTWKRAGGC